MSAYDSAYDSRANRKAIFNRGMIPNIPENLRGRSTPKRGRKPIFAPALLQERFFTIERVFAWEDKFRRLLLRFERISQSASGNPKPAPRLQGADDFRIQQLFTFVAVP